MPEKKNLPKQLLGFAREIGLVMIGILLALQVNNWAASIKEEKEEHRLLLNFVENLNLDIQQIDSLVEGTRQSINKADSIMDILNNPDGMETKFLDLQLSLLFNYYFFTNDGAYWEASSTGKIELIEKTALRKQIFDYYRLAATTTNDDEVFETNTNINTPVWIELVGSTKAMMNRLTGKMVADAPALNISELASNRKYLSILITIKKGGEVQINAWNIRRTKAATLVNALEKELMRWD